MEINKGRGAEMARNNTQFNRFGCDKELKIPRSVLYERMYSTENVHLRAIEETYNTNREIIRGTKL